MEPREDQNNHTITPWRGSNRRVVDRTGERLDPTWKTIKYSRFLVLVNPQCSIDKNKEPARYQLYKECMGQCAEYLLEDSTIKKYLEIRPVGESGKLPKGVERKFIEYPRQYHLDNIISIPEEYKEAALEDSTVKYKRLHVHYTFVIVHRTNFKLDREAIENLAYPFFKDFIEGPRNIYVHTSGEKANSSFLAYLRKNREFGVDE